MEKGDPVPDAATGDGDNRVRAVECQGDRLNSTELFDGCAGCEDIHSPDGTCAESVLIVGRSLQAANIGRCRQKRPDWSATSETPGASVRSWLTVDDHSGTSDSHASEPSAVLPQRVWMTFCDVHAHAELASLTPEAERGLFLWTTEALRLPGCQGSWLVVTWAEKVLC